MTGALTCTLWTMPVLGSLGIWDLMTHGPGLSGIFLILGFLAAYVCFLGILCWMCAACRRLRIVRRLLVWMLLWIPFLNYGLALYVRGLAKQETDHILYRISLDDVRAEKNVCSTKYPLLLVHGVGFRDFHYFNYWGRIPRALKKNGARVFYGHQEAWGTVEENAGILREKIFEILRETGEEKVNIIAHSKGGLDSRYLISGLHMAPYVASPDHHLYAPPRLHAGGSFNEAAGFSVPGDLRPYGPVFWNAGRPGAQRLCGQPPVVLCLGTGINRRYPDSASVYYQSYASMMKCGASCWLLSIPYWILKLLDAGSDGLVTEESARWTNFRGTLKKTYLRGISHGDMIDLARKDLQRLRCHGILYPSGRRAEGAGIIEEHRTGRKRAGVIPPALPIFHRGPPALLPGLLFLY